MENGSHRSLIFDCFGGYSLYNKPRDGYIKPGEDSTRYYELGPWNRIDDTGDAGSICRRADDE